MQYIAVVLKTGYEVNLTYPRIKAGEPQRAEGASSNTPPTAFCLSPT